MRVLRLAWLGVPTPQYEAMVAFLRDVLGLAVAFEEPTTTELSLPNDDRIQVFAPGDPYYAFFTVQGAGPVALFEVEDVHQAAAELRAAGVELLGPMAMDAHWEWLHLRAPDGHVYELASRRVR